MTAIAHRSRQIGRRVERLRDATGRVELQQPCADWLLRRHDPQLIRSAGAERRQVGRREHEPARAAVKRAARRTRRDRRLTLKIDLRQIGRRQHGHPRIGERHQPRGRR